MNLFIIIGIICGMIGIWLPEPNFFHRLVATGFLFIYLLDKIETAFNHKSSTPPSR